MGRCRAAGWAAACDVAPAKGYEGWQPAHFTLAARMDDTVSGETADADGDGWTNLLEYVTGRDPWREETEPLLTPGMVKEGGASFFVVAYDRRAELIDTVVLVEHTSDFAAWTTNNVDQARQVTPAAGGLARVQAWIPVAEGAAAARLRAFRP